MANPKCSECGAEIETVLVHVSDAAPWICLECSGASLFDLVGEDDLLD